MPAGPLRSPCNRYIWVFNLPGDGVLQKIIRSDLVLHQPPDIGSQALNRSAINLFPQPPEVSAIHVAHSFEPSYSGIGHIIYPECGPGFIRRASTPQADEINETVGDCHDLSKFLLS